MTRLDRRRLFLKKLAALVMLIDQHEIPVCITAFYRSPEEQKKCFDAGTSKCDGYTKRSRHQDWLAADFAIITDDGKNVLWDDARYTKIGELAGKVGLKWKPIPGDIYHIELGDE